MSEAFLHYLWQFQYFDKHELQTTTGDPIQVFNPGFRNSHAGPDFQNARMKIGGMEWIGSTEIHIYASGWMEHKHDRDPSYENVVLHVVWENDINLTRNDGSLLPTLELRKRVDNRFLLDYQRLVNSPAKIPCSHFVAQVKDVTRFAMMDRVMMDRLETKSARIFDMLNKNHNDWEETCYQLLARSFGYKINAEPFEQLARLLPYKVLRKHMDKLLHVEALLFGQAGFLEEDMDDAYYKLLKREYNVLRQKYKLSDRRLSKAQWKFLRLRPANFPTIRLAEFSALLFSRPSLFSTILETEKFAQLVSIFSAKQSEFWSRHYTFSTKTKDLICGLGSSGVSTLVINAVVPLLVAYGKCKDEQRYVDRAVGILQETPAESNSIIAQWRDLGLKARNAFDSQALIELATNYCIKRRCLECSIGVSLITPRSE